MMNQYLILGINKTGWWESFPVFLWHRVTRDLLLPSLQASTGQVVSFCYLLHSPNYNAGLHVNASSKKRYFSLHSHTSHAIRLNAGQTCACRSSEGAPPAMLAEDSTLQSTSTPTQGVLRGCNGCTCPRMTLLYL